MDAVYKKIEVVGTSTTNVTDAINNAVKKASQSLHHISWFEVGEIRGRVENDTVTQYQVTVKIGFRLED